MKWRALASVFLLQLLVGCSALEEPRLDIEGAPLVDAPPAELQKAAVSGGPGFDFLGIRSYYWNCDAMLWSLSTLPYAVPCGWFDDETFVDKRKRYDPDACLRRMLGSGYCSEGRGHLAWSDHKPLPASVLIPRAQRLNSFAREFPQVPIRMSHICEHNMSSPQSGNLFSQLHPYAPNVSGLVDSSMQGNAAPGIPLECHGPTAICPAKSLDGQSTFDVDVERFKKTGAMYSLLWNTADNCRRAHEDRPPPQRTDCPTADQFNLEIRSWYPSPPWPPGPYNIDMPASGRPGAPPAGFKPQSMRGEIWKVMSDNHGSCKGKDCKPVAILNRRYNGLRLLAMNGQKITDCPYFGPFQDQFRHYCKMTAFQAGQLAEQLAQSEFGYLDAPGYRVVINIYKRGGVFR